MSGLCRGKRKVGPSPKFFLRRRSRRILTDGSAFIEEYYSAGANFNFQAFDTEVPP